MKIHRHNLAMQWITRRRTNEVQGKADPVYIEFKNYQAALSDGFEGTMEDYTVQQFEQGGRVKYQGAGLVDHGPEGVRQGYAEKRIGIKDEKGLFTGVEQVFSDAEILEEAKKLEQLVKKKKIIFAVTHNYSAYPMLREAKALVEKGQVGNVLVINVEYPQGYTVGIKKKDEASTLKWRLDKKMCGPSMILAEIGTHAYHLLRYVTGLEVKEVSAEVNSLSPELSVDDNAFLILRMKNKARASIWVSSAATGGENGLKIRVYGTKGSVEWLQDDPNILKFTELNKSTKIITRANNEVSNLSLKSSRLAAGHPEGFFEAFANIYTEFADTITSNKKQKGTNYKFPNLSDGVKGIKFIFAAKKSSNSNSKWVKL